MKHLARNHHDGAIRILRWLLLFTACLPLAATDLPTVMPSNVKIVHFASASLAEERTLLVILPLDYETSTSRYPTLYLLHGADADFTDWSRGTNLTSYAARHHLIIVTPDASRGWYINSVSDPKARFEDFIVKDVISYIDAHFRTIPEPFARAIGGVSMGGYGAMFLGLKHYDIFAAIGDFSGALHIAHFEPSAPQTTETEEQRKGMEDLLSRFGPFGSQERKDRDVFALLDKVPPGQMPMLFLVCGAQDELVLPHHQFLDELAKRRIPYEYRELSPRGHEWKIWDEEIPVFLDKLDQLPNFGSSLPASALPQK